MLEQELALYAQNLPKWLEDHADDVVVVKGDEVVGFFADEDQAITEGARRFGISSFLVRRIQASQQEACLPALTLGLLSGHSQFSGRLSGPNR